VRRHLRPIRLIVAVAVVASVSVVLLLPSGPVSARAPRGPKVVCKEFAVQTDLNSSGYGKAIFASCNQLASTGGYGTMTFSPSHPTLQEINWASGGMTAFTDTEVGSQGGCPGVTPEFHDFGTVTAQGGPAIAPAIGTKVDFFTCQDFDALVGYLKSGTVAKF
jgi:hypothetical protein